MKFLLALCAVLAITGLGEALRPPFGKGPLHQDLNDFLDLVPYKKAVNVITRYWKYDHEVQEAIRYLSNNMHIIKDLMTEFQAIPETINLFNYLQKENVYIYEVMNKINKNLGIEELVPPKISTQPLEEEEEPLSQRRTGGLSGFFREMKSLLNYDDFITLYADKMKNSPAFSNFINELKSNNFQQLVNKTYNIKSLQLILNHLKTKGVNTRLLADAIFVVLGITVPSTPTKTLEEELMDFVNLVPMEKFTEVLVKYVNEDEKVMNALKFMFTNEFHDLLRKVEALKEHSALVVYIQKAGLNVIESIQRFHKAIGMEKYVPPKLESVLKHNIGVQKVGDGMEGMLKDLWELLPLDKIDALYQEKLKTSKVFADFIAKMESPELQKLVTNLYGNAAYKELIMKSRDKGLELNGLTKLAHRIFGIKFPY